jgi:pyrroline-5-carboxylate reductase
METKGTKTLGFLGFGQMGSAIAEGLARFCPETEEGGLRMYAYAPHADRLREKTAGLPVTPVGSAEELADLCGWILLAVKPDQLEKAVAPIRSRLADKAVVSVVNAKTHGELRRILGPDARIQYVMPNTPMKVGAGVALFEEENSLSAEESETLAAWFSSISVIVRLPGEKIAAAASLSGCGPAFFFMAAEALGDAGVKNGLKRADAYRLAAATMAGAGKLMLETGLHPGELKDGVCSPGGTTIRGVAALEEDGFRAALIRAVDATLR